MKKEIPNHKSQITNKKRKEKKLDRSKSKPAEITNSKKLK
jgi:hypothetical protein